MASFSPPAKTTFLDWLTRLGFDPRSTPVRFQPETPPPPMPEVTAERPYKEIATDSRKIPTCLTLLPSLPTIMLAWANSGQPPVLEFLSVPVLEFLSVVLEFLSVFFVTMFRICLQPFESVRQRYELSVAFAKAQTNHRSIATLPDFGVWWNQ